MSLVSGLLLPVVVLVATVDLSADLAGGELCCVDVAVGGIRGQDVGKRIKVASCNVLSSDGRDIRGYDRPAHGSTIRRTRLSSPPEWSPGSSRRTRWHRRVRAPWRNGYEPA